MGNWTEEDLERLKAKQEAAKSKKRIEAAAKSRKLFRDDLPELVKDLQSVKNPYLTDAAPLAGPKKSSKFGNVKVERDGKTFDSKRESNHHAELELFERAGEIEGLRHQVEFPIVIVGKDGLQHLICRYIADHVYRRDGVLVVEDSKGHKTRDYKLKKRLMKAVHDIEIQEV